MIKTPKFWFKKNLLSLTLLPISLIYYTIFQINKIITKTYKIKKKVICIGNLTAGGSGKTPLSIAIGKILKEMGIEFVYLSRGYGGDNKNILELSKNNNYDPKITGDEPLILKKIATTYICKNRLKAAKEIDKKNEFSTIVLDDGYQNNSLYKNLNILVIDGSYGFGNHLLLPAGPLRQTIKSGLKVANLVVVIGDIKDSLSKILPQNKLIKSKIIIKNIQNYQNKKFLAFCGIGYPKKFFDLLTKNQVLLENTIEFPDHYKYENHDLENIIEIANKKNLKIVTTEKDWVKLDKKYQDIIDFIEIDLIFENPHLLKNKIFSIY